MRKTPQLFLATIKTNAGRTIHLTADGSPDSIKMLCGKKFDQNRIVKPFRRRLPHSQQAYPELSYGIEKLDWDDCNSGRICSCCMHTNVAKISKYEHQVIYEPNWRDFSAETTTEVECVVAFQHNIFTARLSGFYKIIDGLLFRCGVETPGCYPSVRCKQHHNGSLYNQILFNEHHQFQVFEHSFESVAPIVEERTDRFCFMLNNQLSLNAIDKILISEAVVVGLDGSEDDD